MVSTQLDSYFCIIEERVLPEGYDQELQKLNAQAAVLQTARMAYAEALKEELPKDKKQGLVFN